MSQQQQQEQGCEPHALLDNSDHSDQSHRKVSQQHQPQQQQEQGSVAHAVQDHSDHSQSAAASSESRSEQLLGLALQQQLQQQEGQQPIAAGA
jgi:hypothetical protein